MITVVSPTDVPNTVLRAFCISGSRHATTNHFLNVIHGALCNLEIRNSDVFIHGAARGVDSLVGEYLQSAAPWPVAVPMHAQWERHGRGAGPRRNEQMLRIVTAMSKCGYRPFLLAFPRGKSPGTRQMIRIWENARLTKPLIFELPILQDDQ
jgi:hypothetical protein